MTRLEVCIEMIAREFPMHFQCVPLIFTLAVLWDKETDHSGPEIRLSLLNKQSSLLALILRRSQC